MYQLQYLPGARKFFKKVREKGLKAAFTQALSQLARNPYIGKQKSGDIVMVRFVAIIRG